MDFIHGSVQRGISPRHLNQLIEYTHSDPAIKKFTSDFKRFPDEATFNKWKEGATIYTLISKEDIFLGIIWFRPLNLPAEFSSDLENSSDYGFTVAVRLYKEARGKGLFKPFLESAIEMFKKTETYEKTDIKKGIWLLTDENNLQAQAAFERFGFKRVNIRSGRLLMVL